jgi:hypothetical protein
VLLFAENEDDGGNVAAGSAFAGFFGGHGLKGV